MQDWAESELAWELAGTVGPRLSKDARAAIYASIGAGNSYAAIVALLEVAAGDPSVLSLALVDRLRDWLDAYRYSADAARLHRLLTVPDPAPDSRT
jgi:hypothetical protein